MDSLLPGSEDSTIKVWFSMKNEMLFFLINELAYIFLVYWKWERGDAVGQT